MALIRTKVGSGKPPKAEPPPEEEKKRQTYKVAVDVVNEAIVVAAAFATWRDPERRQELLSQVRADYFATALYAAIWRALEEMNRRRLDYDPRTLVDLCGGSFALLDVAELVEVHPEPPPSLEHHIERLKWSAAKVRAVKGPLAALLEAMESPATPPERVRILSMELSQTLQGASRGILRDDREVAELTVGRVRRRHDGIAIYPFNLPGMDLFENGEPRIVPGAEPGGLTLLAGLPGSGKSAFAKALALGQAELGRRVLYCSWEMGFERDLEVMAALRRKLDVSRLRTGKLEKQELEALEEEIWMLSKLIRFTDRPFAGERRKWSNEEALDELGNAIIEDAADVVVVDLWKRMLRYTRPEDEELALTIQQKVLQDTKCHGILLHQLNAKDVERRADNRPTRDALKGSSGYLEMPDNIFGIHRPGRFGRAPDTTAELIVLKQRDWKEQILVTFDWSGEHQTFLNGRSGDYAPPGTEGKLDDGVSGILDKRFGSRDGKSGRGKFKR